MIAECATKYPKVFFTVSKDKLFTGNLEISLEKMKVGEDEEQIKEWVHRKNGKSEGFPQNDWPSFYQRLDRAMKVVDGVLESSGATKNISSIVIGISLGCTALFMTF